VRLILGEEFSRRRNLLKQIFGYSETLDLEAVS